MGSPVLGWFEIFAWSSPLRAVLVLNLAQFPCLPMLEWTYQWSIPLQGAITNILEENVVQPLLVSTSAVHLSAETVRSILKIDDIVSERVQAIEPQSLSLPCVEQVVLHKKMLSPALSYTLVHMDFACACSYALVHMNFPHPVAILCIVWISHGFSQLCFRSMYRGHSVAVHCPWRKMLTWCSS